MYIPIISKEPIKIEVLPLVGKYLIIVFGPMAVVVLLLFLVFGVSS